MRQIQLYQTAVLRRKVLQILPGAGGSVSSFTILGEKLRRQRYYEMRRTSAAPEKSGWNYRLFGFPTTYDNLSQVNKPSGIWLEAITITRCCCTTIGEWVSSKTKTRPAM